VKGSLIAVGFETYDQRFLTGERRERTHFAAEPNPLDLIKSHIEDPFRFRIAVFNVPPARSLGPRNSGRVAPTRWVLSQPLPKTKMTGQLAERSVTSASSSFAGAADPSATSILALLPIGV
jgi:hypothetical protein